jgi:hypothetical protein
MRDLAAAKATNVDAGGTLRRDGECRRSYRDQPDVSGEGLEFPAVAVMACDDEVLPLQERIEAIADDADLEEVYNTVRNLLYVACSRARDHLLVTGVEPGSEFLRPRSIRSVSMPMTRPQERRL